MFFRGYLPEPLKSVRAMRSYSAVCVVEQHAPNIFIHLYYVSFLGGCTSVLEWARRFVYAEIHESGLRLSGSYS